MSLFTSDRFASASASGTDWRDTARQVLEKLESVSTEGARFNLGFIYITDNLVADAGSILTLFRSVMQIEHWVGSVALGLCATDREYVDEPAIVVMVGCFDPDDFCVFPPVDLDIDPAARILAPWLDKIDPMLAIVHGDSTSATDPARTLQELAQLTGGFITGGLSSSRTDDVQFADNLVQGGVSGVLFSQDVKVFTALTQGCTPVGSLHTITRCEDNVVMELDGQRAFDVFTADLKAMAAEKTGKVPDEISLRHEIEAALPFDEGDGVFGPDDIFEGEVHVAFPDFGTDQGNYTVRNALGVDSDKGWIAVAKEVYNGDHMMFVRRDDETVRASLSRMLLDLRERVQKETGTFAPRGAVYISCVARTFSDFGNGPGGEMALVREIIGDVPLAGFYANGEISNHRLYGYTGVLILFV